MLRFENHGVTGGLWRGRLSGGARPGRVVLTQQAEHVAEAVLTPDGDGWRVEVPLPAAIIGDGVQTLLLVADEGVAGDLPGADSLVLARLPLMTGQPLDEDLLAEMAALRAELELVKRELRRLGASGTAG